MKIVVPNGHGTGFFIAPGTILTCAHVVDGAQKAGKAVTAFWDNHSYAVNIQNLLSELHPVLQLQYPDLALLTSDELATTGHPCVYFHTEVHLDDKMYCYGYTDEYASGDPSTYINEGWTNEQHLLLKLKEGQARSGLSGAPALNRRSGGVCGIIKRSRGTETDLGGRAVPTQIIFQALLGNQANQAKQVDLPALQQKFHKQDPRWYACLTQEQREILGLLPPSEGIEVFFLYADVDEDKELANKLERHLAGMQKQRLITTWNKGKMLPGSDEKAAMSAFMNRAKIILLMVSDDFMTQYYLDDTAVERTMEKQKTGTIVIPILSRPTDYKGTPFEKLTPLPTNRTPVTEWANMDSALLDVARGIRRVVEGLKQSTP